MSDVSPLVSILLVNYNGAALLPNCLSSLRKVRHPSHELVVVDNASQDNSLEVLRRFPEVRVITSPENLGFAGGNNLGLPHCQGRLILLLNTDTLVEPPFLQTMVDYLDAHPETAVLQAKMFLGMEGRTLDTCGSFLTWLGFMYHYGLQKLDAPRYDRAYRIFSAKGACLLFRREIIERAGGYLFNPDFFCFYEETDFCHRVWLSGAEVHFLGTARIRHLQGATSSSFGSPFIWRLYFRNQTYALLANLSPASLLLILPGYLVMLLATGCGGLLKPGSGLAPAAFGAVLHSLKNLKKIAAQRSLVRTIRTISDVQLFGKVMKNPRPGYFLKTFQQRLETYPDADL